MGNGERVLLGHRTKQEVLPAATPNGDNYSSPSVPGGTGSL